MATDGGIVDQVKSLLTYVFISVQHSDLYNRSTDLLYTFFLFLTLPFDTTMEMTTEVSATHLKCSVQCCMFEEPFTYYV